MCVPYWERNTPLHVNFLRWFRWICRLQDKYTISPCVDVCAMTVICFVCTVCLPIVTHRGKYFALDRRHDPSSYHRNTTLPAESSSYSEMTKRWWVSKYNAGPKEPPSVCSSRTPQLHFCSKSTFLFPLPHPPFFRLLYSVLPPSVANELRHKRPVPAKRYDNLTILFSGIVGFNAFCSKHASAEGAIKIVNLLNDVYTRFDILTDSRNNPYVYKVGSRDFTLTVYHAFVYISSSKKKRRSV